MTSKEITAEAAKLFSSVERWRAFIDLCDRRDDIVTSWMADFAGRMDTEIRRSLNPIPLNEGVRFSRYEEHEKKKKQRRYYWSHRGGQERPRGVSVIFEVNQGADWPSVFFGLYSRLTNGQLDGEHYKRTLSDF